MRILIVDDDAAMRSLYAAQLRTLGHEIETAANGADAWTKLLAAPVEFVLCDWDMPVMDGLSLCRRIRSGDWPFYIHVVLCTAMSRKADFLQAMEAGADDFIVKPVDAAELRVRVRAAERIVNLEAKLSAQKDNLHELFGKLQAAYDTIQSNLQAAATIQLELLPRKESLSPAVELDWLLLPSLFLAGDMLNYFLVDSNTLVFYHLDVAGHGIPAALMSVMLNRVLMPLPSSPITRQRPDGASGSIVPPAELMAELNRRFQSADDSYFTMIYGVFDLHLRRVTFCQAGHPGPLLVSRDGDVRCLGLGGFPVGMLPEMEYEEQSVVLAPGDRLVLYSDGIPDCLNAAGERYGMESLLWLLARQATASLPDLTLAVEQDISRWHEGVELSDDVSLVVLESK